MRKEREKGEGEGRRGGRREEERKEREKEEGEGGEEENKRETEARDSEAEEANMIATTITYRIHISNGGCQGDEHVHVGSTVLERLEG